MTAKRRARARSRGSIIHDEARSRSGILDGVDGWRISDLRQRAERGEAIAPLDIVALADALERAQRAGSLPAEFLVRVSRSEHDVDRWTATHPLLRVASNASHPADALALASVELRRVLSDHEWPTLDIADWSTPRVDRAVADACAAADDPAAESLRWALRELDVTTEKLRNERYRTGLRSSVEAGDPDARAQLRADNVLRLQQAGVTESRATWSTDGFGAAADVGLALPSLVIAMTARDLDDVDGLSFDSTRTWHALHHRIVPRPLSQYRMVIASPFPLNAASDLALRRLALRVRTGHNVRASCTYRDLFAEELSALDAGSIAGELSPAWLPLPLDAVRVLCAGTPAETLDIDTLVVRSPGRRGWHSWPTWELAYVTDLPGESDW